MNAMFEGEANMDRRSDPPFDREQLRICNNRFFDGGQMREHVMAPVIIGGTRYECAKCFVMEKLGKQPYAEGNGTNTAAGSEEAVIRFAKQNQKVISGVFGDFETQEKEQGVSEAA